MNRATRAATDDTQPTARRDTASTPDALALLEADHRAVEKLFDAFGKSRGDERDTLEAKAALTQRACEELTMHTIIEEERVVSGRATGAARRRQARCR
ncbi:hypothetical protein OKW27_000655 [Paraburkholderia sp. 35.1]